MAVLRQDLARITLAVLFIAVLIGACLWILRPFLPAMIWWRRAGDRELAPPPPRRLGSGTAAGSPSRSRRCRSLLVFVIPFWLPVGTIVQHSGEIVEWGVCRSRRRRVAAAARLAGAVAILSHGCRPRLA